MNDYKILSDLIEEANNLKEHHATSSAPAFQAWYAKVERFLTKKYGADSYEFNWFNKQRFSLPLWNSDTPIAHFVNACRNGLLTVIPVLRSYLDEMDVESGVIQDVKQITVDQTKNYEKVFIVHGHDNAMKEAVARIIEQQGIKAIILHEQEEPGATIIEKFEKNSDVGAAVCLFTPDDVGKAVKESDEKKRARQNVVFETGYFIGKLGRNNVILIASNEVDIPSDLQGIVYTSSAEWRISVLRALKKIGFKIDLNILDY